MPSSPIALNESPSASHIHGVPTVPESVIFETNARLVASRLAVAFDHDAVKTCVAVRKVFRDARVMIEAAKTS